MFGEIGLNECVFFSFISDLRDVIAWSLHGGEELIKPARDEMKYIFSLMKRKRGGEKKKRCFPLKSICQQRQNVLLLIKGQPS